MSEESHVSDTSSRTNNRKNFRKNINDFFDKMGQQLSTVKVPKKIFHRYKYSMSNDDLSHCQVCFHDFKCLFCELIK